MSSVSDINGWYDRGEKISFSARPGSGYTESGWTVTDDSGIPDGKRFKKTHFYESVKWSDGPVTRGERRLTVNSALDLTASGVESTGESGVQYLLKIAKGAGVASTNPSTDAYYDSGSSKTVTATYSTGYEADAGAMSYYMNRARVANVTAKKLTYRVSFEPNGGSGTMADGVKTYGEDYTVPVSTFTVKPDNHFIAWNTKADGSGKTYEGGSLYTADAPMTLYAQWEPDRYPVTYYYNCPSGATNHGGTTGPGTKVYGAACTILSSGFSAPTKEGGTYSFGSWNTRADGNGDSYAPGAKYNVHEPLVLYAQWTWTPTTYSVTYQYNCPSGATNKGGTTASQTKTFNVNLRLQNCGFNSPTKSDGYYTFKSWNTKADGTGSSYAAGGTYSTNAAVVLYAQWQWTEATFTYAVKVSGQNCSVAGFYVNSTGGTLFREGEKAKVKPGDKIIFKHDSSYMWEIDDCENYDSTSVFNCLISGSTVGRPEDAPGTQYCCFTVPSGVSGAGVLAITDIESNGCEGTELDFSDKYQSYYIAYTSGWVYNKRKSITVRLGTS